MSPDDTEKVGEYVYFRAAGDVEKQWFIAITFVARTITGATAPVIDTLTLSTTTPFHPFAHLDRTPIRLTTSMMGYMLFICCFCCWALLLVCYLFFLVSSRSSHLLRSFSFPQNNPSTSVISVSLKQDSIAGASILCDVFWVGLWSDQHTIIWNGLISTQTTSTTVVERYRIGIKISDRIMGDDRSHVRGGGQEIERSKPT